MNKHLKYYLSMVLTVISIIAIISFSILAIKTLTSQRYVLGTCFAVCAIGSFVGYKLLFEMRTNARNELEFDESGNRKSTAYKNLSAKQKKEIDMQRLVDNERIIGAGELKKATHAGSKTPDEDIQALIGLNNVKEEITRLSSKMEYDKKYKITKNSTPRSYHMCFMGSPGTGKTTVARIMAGILYKYGCIKENKYVETGAAFLKGTTSDTTLKRLRAVLRHATGGVLFIDEAYSLLDGLNASEIIAELVKYMEDHKHEFVLILAGYENDMKRLIDSNAGLASRISKYLHFKDYEIHELKDIFTAVANGAGYCVDESGYTRFEEEIVKEKSKKNFGNARSVQNLFQQALDQHAYNTMAGQLPEDKLYVITGKDFARRKNGESI